MKLKRPHTKPAAVEITPRQWARFEENVKRVAAHGRVPRLIPKKRKAKAP